MTDTVYIDSTPDPRRNINRYWLTKKERDIGDSIDIDRELESWIWSNADYHRGLIVVDTALGFNWGKYPGTPEGVARMKQDLAGRKIWETYEIDDDFHIKLWGKVPETRPARSRAKPKVGSRNVRRYRR